MDRLTKQVNVRLNNLLMASFAFFRCFCSQILASKHITDAYAFQLSCYALFNDLP